MNKKSVLNGKKIAKIAMFSAIAFAIHWLSFPIFPSAPFLELDFSNVFVLIGGFYLGPIEGIIILIIKELLYLISGKAIFVGQIANIIIGIGFLIIPTVWYKKHKGIKNVIITLIIACVMQIVFSLLTNKFITFPLYGISEFNTFILPIILFNLIKGVAVSLITIILYKRIKKILDF